jgi:hypothetical protein
VGVDNPTTFDLNLDAGVTYKQYITDEETIQNQSGLDSTVNGRLTLNPAGAVAFAISDSFVRTLEAPSVDSVTTTDRIYNKVGGNLIIQPGGKILTLDLGGSFEVLAYDKENSDLDRQTLGLSAEGKWKFLPKTALVIQGSQGFVSYAAESRTVSDTVPTSWVGAASNVNSSPLRVMGGLSGLLGMRLSVLALAGYGNGYYDEGENFSGAIGRGEVGYEIGPTSRFRLGYERDFVDSSFSNYASFHRGFLRYNQQFSGFFNVRLEGGLKYYEFAEVVNVTQDTIVNSSNAAYSTVNRRDPIANGVVEGSFIFAEIWRLGTKYQVEANLSSFEINHGSPSPNPDPNDIYTQGLARVSYVKHRFFLTGGVEW